MTLVSLACVVLAVVLFLRPRPGVQAAVQPAGDATVATSGAPGHRTAVRWLVGGLLAALVLVSAYALSGARAVVVTTAALMVIATSARLSVGYRSTRRAMRAQVEVAHACSVLASQIRVGRVPAEALLSAAQDCPVLAGASTAQDLGGDATIIWRARSRLPGHGGLADLARAWQVSTRTGAPLARSLEQVSDALTADQALRVVVAGELAAPRATGKIMAALPLCGLGLGYLIGGDPLHFLLANRYGWGCLLVGVGLACSGVLWIDRLAQRAEVQG